VPLFIRTRAQVSASTSRWPPNQDFRLVMPDSSVVITLDVEDDTPTINNSGTPVIVCIGKYAAEADWHALLDGIAHEVWPPGFVANVPNSFLFDFYPDGLQQLLTQAVQELATARRRLLELIRWRLDHSSWGTTAKLTSGTLDWSLDQESWYRLRLKPQFSARTGPGDIEQNEATAQIIQALLNHGSAEPLGREMWHLAAQSQDPRTTIILAVSAVEVELKRLISEFAPQAAWLITKLPAPPIVDIIRQYLPSLPQVPVELLPPPAVWKTLATAVSLRNTLLHVGRRSMADEAKPVDVRQVLQTTSDLLWLFDAYRGHSWALGYLSAPTRQSLSLPVEEYELEAW
jgi:hypothetical protein